MKKLLIILAVILFACEKQEPCKTYTIIKYQSKQAFYAYDTIICNGYVPENLTK
jgi:hypothetical protein